MNRPFRRAGATRAVAVVAAVGAVGAVFVLTGCTAGAGTTGETADGAGSVDMTVLGAASTRVINDDLADLATGLDPAQNLSFVNAGSSTLVQQLADGSPGDLLITANRETMDMAVENGSVAEPRVVATNSMVMVVPRGNPAGITGVDSSLDDAVVVLCDPQVPCGTISQTLIDELGVTITPASLEHSVSDTLGRVVSGEADAGWVYHTDAVAAGDAVEVIDIPEAEEHPNSLMAAVTAATEKPERARVLLDLLTSGEMAQVWTDRGFTPAETK